MNDPFPDDDGDAYADYPIGICRHCDKAFLKTEFFLEFCSWDCEERWLSGN